MPVAIHHHAVVADFEFVIVGGGTTVVVRADRERLMPGSYRAFLSRLEQDSERLGLPFHQAAMYLPNLNTISPTPSTNRRRRHLLRPPSPRAEGRLHSSPRSAGLRVTLVVDTAMRSLPGLEETALPPQTPPRPSPCCESAGAARPARSIWQRLPRGHRAAAWSRRSQYATLESSSARFIFGPSTAMGARGGCDPWALDDGNGSASVASTTSGGNTCPTGGAGGMGGSVSAAPTGAGGFVSLGGGPGERPQSGGCVNSNTNPFAGIDPAALNQGVLASSALAWYLDGEISSSSTIPTTPAAADAIVAQDSAMADMAVTGWLMSI